MWVRAVAVAGCLLMAAPAFGITATPHCPQLVDRQGDQSPPTDPAADLRSVALASTSQSISIVIGYQSEPEVTTPVAGHIYAVALDSGEAAVEADAYLAPSGADFALYRRAGAGAGGSAATGIGRLSGHVDVASHTVQMTVPYAMAPDVLRVGGRVTATAAVSTAVISPMVPVANGRLFASDKSDKSDASLAYRLGSRGC